MWQRLLVALGLALLLSSCALLQGTSESITTDDRILVVGATGKTGRLVVEQLQAAGYPVVAMVRSVERGQAILGDDVAMVVADITEPSTLAAAFEDVDAVINTAGAALKGKGRATPEWIDYQGTVNLVAAAQQHRIKKFVLVSSMGVTQEDHFLNRIANDVLKWKFKGEEVLRGSGLTYSIIRPGGLTDKPGPEQVVKFLQGDQLKGGPIRRVDLARVVVAALGSEAANGKTYEVLAELGKSEADFSERFSLLLADKN